MKSELMKRAIRILMESRIYWTFPPAVRLDMVYYFIFAQEVRR